MFLSDEANKQLIVEMGPIFPLDLPTIHLLHKKTQNLFYAKKTLIIPPPKFNSKKQNAIDMT